MNSPKAMTAQTKEDLKKKAKEVIEGNLEKRLNNGNIFRKVRDIHQFLYDRNGGSCYPDKIETNQFIALNAGINPGPMSFLVVKPSSVNPIFIGKEPVWHVVRQNLDTRLYFKDVYGKQGFQSYDLTDNRAQDFELLVHRYQLDKDVGDGVKLIEEFSPENFEGFWDADEYQFSSESDLETLTQIQEEQLLEFFRPDVYKEILDVLGSKPLKKRQEEVNEVAEYIDASLENLGFKGYTVQARAKNMFKIFIKATSDYLSVPDIRGLRIITNSMEDLILATGASAKALEEIGHAVQYGWFANNRSAYRDNAAWPKTNLFQTLKYNSVGTEGKCRQKNYEVQLRSRFMDRMTSKGEGFTGSATDYYIRDSNFYAVKLGVSPEKVREFVRERFTDHYLKE